MSGGEGAKNSGEIGEKIASSLLDKIGWNLSIHNVSTPCNSQEHRAETDNQRKSHGEDQIFVYHNPFHDDVTEFVHVSVKNTKNAYPTTEAARIRKIKKIWMSFMRSLSVLSTVKLYLTLKSKCLQRNILTTRGY